MSEEYKCLNYRTRVACDFCDGYGRVKTEYVGALRIETEKCYNSTELERRIEDEHRCSNNKLEESNERQKG